jgi:hypothetical protein
MLPRMPAVVGAISPIVESMIMHIKRSDFAEMQALVAAGDTDLNEIRETFKTITGRETALDDVMLTAASFTDDDDDELLVKNIIDIEDNGLVISPDAAVQPEEQESETVG